MDAAPRKEQILSQHVPEAPPQRWSNCLKVGSTVYVSGTTARGPDGETLIGDGEYEQTRTIFTKIRHLVEAAGGVMDDVTKMTIFVTRIQHNTEVWRARKEFFSGAFPASTLVEVSRLAKPEIYVEIDVIAHIGCSQASQGE